MPADVPSKLLYLFENTLKENYIWIEDVYLTGILAEILDIDMVDLQDLIQFTEPTNEINGIMVANVNMLDVDSRIKRWHELFD